MRSPSRARRWLREPLVLFAVLGAGIFGLHRVVGGADGGGGVGEPDGEGAAPIAIDDAFVAGLIEARRAAGQPSDEEAAIAAFVREEVLVREARALGLDRGDPIVRQRLVQKMELVLEASVEVPPASEAELEAALAGDPRYLVPGTLTFDHVFFRSARPDPEADARAALAAAQGEPSGGDPFTLGPHIGPRTDDALRSAFGPELTAALREAPLDVWSGPFSSAYGVHLVRVTGRTEAVVPPLEAVRERVAADLERTRRAEAVRRAIAERVESARIVRE